MDLNGPWMPFLGRTGDEFDTQDGTNAPDVHWDWNIQGMYVPSNPPLATENLLENTDGVLRVCVGGGSEHPISVLLGRQPATFYLC